MMPTDILHTGSKSGIGAAPVALAPASYAASSGVQIRAASTNTAIVYVGNTDVTANTDDNNDGYPLAAGDSIFVPVRNTSMLRVVAAAPGQKVYYLVL